MTSNLDSSRASSGDRARTRAYHRDFWPSIVGYTVVLAAVTTWGRLDGHSPWRFVLALLLIAPALGIVRAVLRHAQRIDDFQRLVLLQGLAGGFLVAMVASLTVGFLGIAGLRLPAAGWIVYSAGMLGWAVTGGLAHRR